MKTLAGAADDFAAARREFVHVALQATGIYRLVAWMLRWWEAK